MKDRESRYDVEPGVLGPVAKPRGKPGFGRPGLVNRIRLWRAVRRALGHKPWPLP